MKGKITKRLVDSLQPDPARDVLVWDTELAGFGLRVSRGGVKSYIFQYKIPCAEPAASPWESMAER